jgi:hypothetical protein
MGIMSSAIESKGPPIALNRKKITGKFGLSLHNYRRVMETKLDE